MRQLVIIFFKEPTLEGKNVHRLEAHGTETCGPYLYVRRNNEITLTYELFKIAHYQVVPMGGVSGTD